MTSADAGGRPGARRRRLARDQAESPFSLILEELLDVHPFARGAAIVDLEGETVDYAGNLDPYELRVAAATFGLVIRDLDECRQLGPVVELGMRMGKAGYVLRVLDPSYSLLVVLRKLGTFCVSQRMLIEVEARILAEAGLPIVRKPKFFRVDVATQGRGPRERPARLRAPLISVEVGRLQPPDEWMPLEVLGALVGVTPGERAFRVRLPTGAEFTLLRDAAKVWFADEPVEALMKPESETRPALFQPVRT